MAGTETDPPPLSPVALPLAALATALCLWWGTGLDPRWPLTWLAPLPILVVAPRAGQARVAAAAFIAWALGGLNMLAYLRSVAPLPAVAGALVVPAGVFALCVLLFRGLSRRGATWLAAFGFPAAWTSFEFLLSLTSPHGTFGSLAYTQTDLLPLLQVASVTGIWGVTFLLLLPASAIAAAWNASGTGRRFAPVTVALALVALVLALGTVRLQRPPAHSPLTVGLAATDATLDRFDAERAEDALPVVEDYARRIDVLAGRGAKVVVLPEKFVGVTPAYVAAVENTFARAAARGGVTVVAGLNRLGEAALRNVAVVYSPTRGSVATYDKVHMVPGWEAGYRPGDRPLILPPAGNGDSPWGVAICKDMDFPALGRLYGEAGVGLLLVAAWDFGRDGRLHARMAVVRGVESGFALVRTAQRGLLTVSDDRGRVVAEMPSGEGPEALLTARVAPGSGRTPYARWGDWFGWLCLLLLAAALVRTTVQRRIAFRGRSINVAA